MLELWQHAISPLNLPFTALFGLVMLYWVMVILGFLDMDHAHADVGVDGHVEGHLDVHGEGHFDSHADGDVHADHPGMVSGFFQFLHMGEMPFMIVVTILSVILWAGSVLLNYFFNPDAILMKAAMIFVPLFVGAVIVTHFAALPFKKMYQLMEKDYDSHQPVVGQVGKVVTTEVTSDFGQVQIIRNGAPVTVNARTSGAAKLSKGEEALVTEKNKEKNTFLVVKYEQPNLEK